VSHGAAARFRLQAEWCQRLGSPLYADLLGEVAREIDRAGPAAAIVAAHEHDPPGSALALRFMGAVHRIVLEGGAPELARYYPSAGGDLDRRGAWPAFQRALAEQASRIRELLSRPVQTNEVGRSAALLGGFLSIVRQTGLPLRLLEIGASAGLNLRWDRYRYESGEEAWGDPASPVRIVDVWGGRPPFLAAEVTIAERRGCDPSPVDLATAEGRLTLLSYLWADQVARIAMLRGALEVAGRLPAEIDRADATEWLELRLAAATPGLATIVFHSIVMQYLTAADRERVTEILAAAGARATAAAPLAWLRMEPGGDEAEVLLTLWPGGEPRTVATSGFHGRPVRWRG
jgi:hypothetical protein